MLNRDTAPRPSGVPIAHSVALAIVIAAASAPAARGADALSAATVAVQAVEPTGDGRARVTECSGALIAPDIVLTSGHCLDGASGPARVAVFVYRDGRPLPQPRIAKALARHPDHVVGWNRSPGDPETRQREIAADLALIRLGSPVTDALPLTLRRGAPVTGALAGTGAAGPGGRSGALKRAYLTNARVSTGSGAPVAFATAGRTICNGDSGGPVVDGAGAVWGVTAAVLRPSSGCGTRVAITPVDPASDGFRRMREALGRP